MNDEIYQRILAKNRAEIAAQRSQQQEAVPAAVEEAEEAQPVDNTSMSDFVAQHRTAKLPKVQRQNQLLQKQRLALYGESEIQDCRSRGDYED